MFGLIRQAATCWPALGACMSVLMLASTASEAALTLNGTRVVFESDKRSTAIIVSNPSDRPYAVQTWVNTAADDTTTEVPLIPSPPLFRLNPGKEQQVQINGLPNNLPLDRESLFYFNVQEIPQIDTNERNVLNVALRTRIKLFYRPSQLKDNPITRLKDLQWSIERQGNSSQLVVTNPTPFHVSFIRVEVKDKDKRLPLLNAEMVEPLSRRTYPLDGLKPAAGLQVEFSAINDFGGYTVPLTLPIQVNP
ncbi:fimbrial biogenesis chaperone [Pseudomonas umsongensis]|uniref:fimbrial biogenesis chaperone n=1 Tax=Pseudomonas umsongensis TaxID=198618 RepID=UPI0015C169E2|nr:molecular chaperone [Pseudomonas umsongensis]NWL23405.1 pilus assembly protein [Pseudomonas umsongensis]